MLVRIAAIHGDFVQFMQHLLKTTYLFLGEIANTYVKKEIVVEQIVQKLRLHRGYVHKSTRRKS